VTSPLILDGKKLAAQVRLEVAEKTAKLKNLRGITPGLAAVLVGDDPASQVYVRNKRQACADAGMASWLHQLPASTTQQDLLTLVDQLNADVSVHGILVQLPLPKHLDTALILDRISPNKDVDGLHPNNLGLLADGRPRYLPCTPHGVWLLLERNCISWAGKNVVILGRSSIVGKSLALLLLQKGVDATVTVCHSRTPNPAHHLKQADIIVAAIGQPLWLKADMVKAGAVVVDVGIHRKPEGGLCGDVDYAGISPIASAITPVPGGVGPMTIAMLLVNTVESANTVGSAKKL
jgi:methylenetetrahydrofolate dehydrogenase (NADP+)/methenyltetrahydrofolate cyclohydrolase